MFLNPWALFFLVAVGVPVAVHFLTRPKPVVLPISTLRFVREVIQQRRARHWLRDLLLLLLRTSAVLLIVFAVARPRPGMQQAVAMDDDADTVRVVVLDSSQSLSAIDGGTALFEKARAAAAEQLRYRPNLRANLIFAGAKPRPVFDQPSQNFDALRDELARAKSLPEHLDVLRALTLAAEMLAPRDPTDQRRRELVIVSDFQRANWAQADFSVVSKETKIMLESVTPKSPLANLAIAGGRVIGHTAEQAGGRIEIDVGNWSAAAQTVTVEVQVGDATRRLSGECPAGRQTTLTEELSLSDFGWHVGSARIVAAMDALTADDELALAVEVRPRPSYLLITRQAPTLRPSSSHYLECVLAPDGAANGKEAAGSSGSPQVIRSSADKLDAELLARADLIVIDHPGAINEQTVKNIAEAMRRGKPVWYVAAEPADATTLQRLGVELGRSLRMPVAFQPPPQGEWRRNLFLTSVKYDAKPFSSLGESAATLVRDWRFSGGLVSRPIPDAIADDVLATYNDGTACLVVTATDTSSLAVLNADLGASNLPSQAAFVPLVDELMQQLTERRSLTTTAHCGQSLLVRLPVSGTSANSLEIVGPSNGDVGSGELIDEAGGVNWRWPVVGTPGAYRIQQGNQTVFALAVSAPAEESQLDPLSADVLQNRLAANNSVFYRPAGDSEQPRDTLWTWLTVGCLICLLGELGTLLVFRT